ncbi:MAG: hypothetical protein NTV86_14485 [Planctomycetota bacterium]|nr:hypothetical protein [Planctomycetota bacterium]
MRTRTAIVVLGCCLLVASVRADEQDAADAILRQAGNQEAVRGQMAGLAQNFRAMVDDMVSNGNLSEKKGQEITRLVEGITSTDVNHVRKAADLLRQAYAQERARETVARKESLGAAGDEVQNALDKLNALLRQANALRAGEMISVELEAVIRGQTALIADTMRVGKEVLAGQEKLSLEPGKIGEDQEALAERTSGVKELVHVALGEETTIEGAGPLKRAMAFLDEEKIDARMHMAARNIEQRDMLPGLAEQKQALVALNQLVKILGQDDLAAQKDLLEKAKNILAAQTKLRTALEGMNADQFKDKAAQLNAEQKDLENQLETLMKDLANQDAELPEGEEAKEAMDDASDDLGERKQSKAAEDMKLAEEALGEVIESVTQTIPEEEDQAPGHAEPQNMQTMAQEGHSQGMRSSPGEGQGTKKPGKGEGQAKGGKAKPAKPNPNGPPTPGPAQKGGPISQFGNPASFKGKGLYGVRGGNEAAPSTSLGKRDQMALDENFGQAQDLPREYREMLKAYYDKLSRGR